MDIVEWMEGHSLRLHAIQPPAVTWSADDVAASSSMRRRWLTGLLLFNGVGAIGGGIALLVGKIGLPLSLLEGTPFDSYTIPGWILLLAVGGSSTVASAIVWRRLRYGAEAAMLAGAVLLGWIVTEFVMIPEAWAPQLLYFAIALAILALGGRMYRDRSLS